MSSSDGRRRTLRLALALAAPAFFISSVTPGQVGAPFNRPQRSPRPAAGPRFREVAASAGLKFVVDNDASMFKRYIETMAGGIAAFDYDGDGRMDIFFTNGAEIPSLQKTSAKFHNRLFRNDGGMKFTDVTPEAGVAGEGYSVAAAASDYDNDGHVDLFVAGVNRSILYRNLGNGKFEDATAAAGIKSGPWAVGAGWFDFDNDGWLDLFVVNYVQWSLHEDIFCGDVQAGLRTYCHPRYFAKLANTLYRNRRDGTFEDVSESSGIATHKGRGMAVAFADYDDDGWMDALVTNDYAPNFLFRNRGNGTFEERALEAGVAMRENGDYISNMGADFRDYDNDGLPDLSIVALTGQSFPLFRNSGQGRFRDVTYSSRMAALSQRRSGWSSGFADFDNDGWKDLFVSCSHANDLIDKLADDRYRQKNALFLNQGNGTFSDASETAGFIRSPAKAHRGAAIADFNNDGKLDVIVSSLNDPVELWENTTPAGRNWLIIMLQGVKSNRDGIGAKIRVDSQYNQMTTSYGFASSTNQGVFFGLGPKTVAGEIEIRWPSGTVQILKNVKANQVLRVRETTER